ncbi:MULTISPECIES: hypothetical protein [unclassified Mesorhizobium]|uniref:hypothetical protein n=1 Tax=unclassified Mesorhizobium TaxID=325217 RepID=UPI001093E123|nr:MULTISPECIES: hypothetical protein [unclassified Mesorhizobium]TGQ72899.1 hypothetical protein EN848_06115 [bacterium M00.F.Ca.ET.205.01.1.1]TGU53656.1 hypothetical protein EN795_10535 [bacterium M00.F.Ca.ET.152.01.1.1]TGV37154.1 hypothetical protein EN829_010560 [Mesorhizobium sp. M00.F.Ca.ET.186.01.1.1]TGZ41418.1 hypothetical protein EN805_17895 [bacterium M00.F.Ca.ET.162.01.1.1]TGT92066.1 hypothetical protein EN804_03150 [Mesorhizobium sp. M8A.F.Ca.ET.161.01.1.1]
MSEDNLPTGTAQWLGRIAEDAGATAEAVSNVLEEFGVRAQPILPRARTVTATSIRIEGQKKTLRSEDRFLFEWSGLGPGLWALLSEGNSKGKSSILLLVRAALQGRFPGRIKKDIWSWIDSASVGFSIDDVQYEVRILKEVGETDEKQGKALLMRRDGTAEVALYSGSAGEGLTGAVADLFMEELGFERFHAYKSASGSVVEHGWPAMSAALFITGPSKAIFGENMEDGLPLRLIQMFIGLPWVSTYTALASALKRTKDVSDRKRRASTAEKSRIAARLKELTDLLAKKKGEAAKLPDRSGLRLDLDRLDGEVATAQAAVTGTRNSLEQLRTRAMNAAAVHTETRRLLQQAKDEAAAGYVFRKLRPVCCPACESGFQPGRFEAVEAEACGLCGSSEVHGDDDDAANLTAMETAAKDADAAWKSASAAMAKGEKSLTDAEAIREKALRLLKETERQLSKEDVSSQLALDIAVIEGRLEELQREGDDQETISDADLATQRILEAATDLTKRMMEDMQAAIMKDVEGETFKLAEKFGVANLETLSFKPHRMDIRQGGTDNTFGGLNVGENLRMRLAASLATLKVAQARGFGRHPGMLVLDSPAAPEMSAKDFSQLVRAVGEVVAEMPGVQVIVGAVKRPELDAVVDFSHRREAIGSAELF